MYQYVQPFIIEEDVTDSFHKQYENYRDTLFNLLDSPVKSTEHIGGTQHLNYPTEPIIDILVGVHNLHDITALDEKRLNYEGFYRLHHQYKKKVVMAKFNNLIDLKQIVRLHILQLDTPLYHQYQTVNTSLKQDTEVQTFFAQHKQEIYHQNSTIRHYETEKEKYFQYIFKKI
ncbi:GrpB family protein [Staphylococcus canis]|uniref:GrpB family protein n=1 Tax=Staphylococcus canis TaxID=2724942 RepID=A0ABS0T5L9_9STAP|nr:GrpB family protein [Staphylococcus canis]MBI5974049.1 GrpB family protein [Staphylococcus canis]